MGRRLREDKEKAAAYRRGALSMEDLWKREVAEMQRNVHLLQLRVKTLSDRVNELTEKVTILGGDPNQLEMEF
tara:strand:+ start:4684 stop:4902 length:219 start_codon:yes stop_codon:yes gene_type:complete